MINLDEPRKPVYQPPTAKVAAPVPQSKPAVKTFDPPTHKSPSPVSFAKSPTPQQPTFDLSNPQPSGVMRLPTVNFGSKAATQDKKETTRNINIFI